MLYNPAQCARCKVKIHPSEKYQIYFDYILCSECEKLVEKMAEGYCTTYKEALGYPLDFEEAKIRSAKYLQKEQAAYERCNKWEEN